MGYNYYRKYSLLNKFLVKKGTKEGNKRFLSGISDQKYNFKVDSIFGFEYSRFKNSRMERRLSNIFTCKLRAKERSYSVNIKHNPNNTNKRVENIMSNSIKFYYSLDKHIHSENKDYNKNEMDHLKSDEEIPEIFKDGNFILEDRLILLASEEARFKYPSKIDIPIYKSIYY